MNKIKFKTIKNSTIEIFYEKNKNYTVKDMKNLIETQYGWDHKKLKIYKDKYDINSLLNDEYPLDQYLNKKNNNNYFYYLKNCRYIPINIYEEKKDDDSSIEFDFDKFCSNESSSNSLPQFSNSSKDVNKNLNFIFNENKEPIGSDKINSNRKSVNFTNNNNIFGNNDKNKKNSNVINNNIPKTKNDDNNSNKKNSNVINNNIPKTKNIDNNSNSKNNTNINDNNLKINKTNNENNNNKKNESKNKTDNNNNNNFQKNKSEIIQNSNPIPPKNKIKKTATETEEIFTENENQKIEELIGFVGCTRDKAIKALKMTKWDLNEAGNIIFDI